MNKYAALLFFGIFLIAYACKKETVIPVKGSIVGYINVLDESGREMANKAGVRIVLDEKHSTETDAKGYFEIKDVRAGTYKITFEKDGLGTFILYNFVFAGGNVPAVISYVTLVQLPSLELLSHAVEQDGNNIDVSGTFAETESYYIDYYFGNSPDISNSNYEDRAAYSACCWTMTTFTNQMRISEHIAGTGAAYIVAYAVSMANVDGDFSYFNPEAARTVNPAVKKLFDPVKLR